MLVFAVVLGLAIAVLIGIAVVDTNDSPRRAPAMGSDLVQVIQQDYRMRAVQASMKPVELVRWDLAPQTLNELLDLPSDQLHRVDIARMNLLCASRLPSTEGLDIDHALATLDAWAERVAFETERHLYRVNDPRYAETYGGSEAQFRAAMLAQVLQEDLGVKYNMTAEGNFSFADPSVAFIHGMIPPEGKTTADTPGGTCASMPVLYVAVGRRLGYPLKLATTDSHIFVRWDGKDHEKPGFRGYFNCETTNGFVRLDDDYYRTWPYPVTDQQIAVNGFLQSLSPAEEMAQFMAARGHHGMDVGQIGFAARCYENAYRYDRRRPCYRSWFMAAATRTNYEPVTPTLRHMLASLPMQPRRGVRSHVPPTFGTPTPSQTRSRLTPGIPLPPSHPGFGTHRRQDPPFGAVPRVVQPPSPTTYYDPYYQSPR
ncbi:MAG: hypothetical protein AAGI68_03990 [Planctomycetota bacterium]